jgi:hypothetical protein
MFPLGRRVTGKQEKMSNNCWFKRFPPIPGNLHSIFLLAQSRTIDDEFIHIINNSRSAISRSSMDRMAQVPHPICSPAK